MSAYAQNPFILQLQGKIRLQYTLHQLDPNSALFYQLDPNSALFLKSDPEMQTEQIFCSVCISGSDLCV